MGAVSVKVGDAVMVVPMSVLPGKESVVEVGKSSVIEPGVLNPVGASTTDVTVALRLSFVNVPSMLKVAVAESVITVSGGTASVKDSSMLRLLVSVGVSVGIA